MEERKFEWSDSLYNREKGDIVPMYLAVRWLTNSALENSEKVGAFQEIKDPRILCGVFPLNKVEFLED